MQVCVNTILYHRCLPGYFVMNTDFLTMVAIHNNYYSWLNLQAEGQLNTLLADLSSYLTNTSQGLFTALKKPLEWPTCFLLFLHSEGKEPVQWVLQHMSTELAEELSWCTGVSECLLYPIVSLQHTRFSILSLWYIHTHLLAPFES